jgi:hypothetical protein
MYKKVVAAISHLLSEIIKWELKKNTMNYDQNDCQQFSFITPLFPTFANTLKTKVGDVVGCIFEVECSVGGFLILKQIIVRGLELLREAAFKNGASS